MQIINEAIAESLRKMEVGECDFRIERPKDEAHGDFSSNVAMVLAKQLGKNPRVVAEEIAELIRNQETGIKNIVEKIEVAGPGFVNFYLRPEYVVQLVAQIGADYGQNEQGKGKLAIVEYSSPNIAKPFTIGHLRSTVIGDAVANLLEATGWRVLRDNHLGDWGTQFGKQIYAIINLGEGSKTKNLEMIEKSPQPVNELVKLYVEFHQMSEKDPTLDDKAREWFLKLEQGDTEARQLWQQCIDWSWREFARIYELLGIKHSTEFADGRGLGESFFEDKMGVVIDILKDKGLLQTGKEGAQLVFFPNDKYPPAMILKKDGSSLYHTRDLATDYYRRQTYHPDLVVNEVGAEQQLYFQQLFEIERMLGWFEPRQRVHIMHGMYRFADRKMSTRKGNVIWLEEVLKEAIARAKELAGGDQKLAEQVGVGALKWNDLKGETKRDIVFDWDQILTMNGDSGPYIQYTYARGMSVLKKVALSAVQADSPDSVVPSEVELTLLKYLLRYPEVVAESAMRYSPHLLCNFLFELAARFNRFYGACRIVEAEPEARSRRIMITTKTTQILKSGLSLLGIEAPEKM